MSRKKLILDSLRSPKMIQREQEMNAPYPITRREYEDLLAQINNLKNSILSLRQSIRFGGDLGP